VTVLDVWRRWRHVARRLREAGATVVTVDPAPGMQADTRRARDLPFADGKLRRRRLPARRASLRRRARRRQEMARVAKHRVVICDNTLS